jgi:hypothetical protein
LENINDINKETELTKFREFAKVLQSIKKNKSLKNNTSNEKEGKKNLIKSKISSSALFQFECRIKQIIMNSGSTTFTKVANKWNSSILGLITYFREFLQKNKNFLAIFSRS